jgi:hypothetical protein
MKNLLYILLFIPLFATAQTIEDWEFQPQTTDNNMTVVFPSGTLNDFAGGLLMAFVDGQPVSGSFNTENIVYEDDYSVLSH